MRCVICVTLYCAIYDVRLCGVCGLHDMFACVVCMYVSCVFGGVWCGMCDMCLHVCVLCVDVWCVFVVCVCLWCVFVVCVFVCGQGAGPGGKVGLCPT